MVRTFRAVRYAIDRALPPRMLNGTFTLGGKEYEYFCHGYNSTWKNERAVEIPIIWDQVQACKGRILEIGNVLPHYFPTTHDVIDKGEAWPGVINMDAVDLEAEEPYDLVVSISTLEHVGFDEPMEQPGKLQRTIRNLLDNLRPGGRLIATLPLGYNPEVDALVGKGGFFDETHFLVRDGDGWVEASSESALSAGYRFGVGARAIVVATMMSQPNPIAFEAQDAHIYGPELSHGAR